MLLLCVLLALCFSSVFSSYYFLEKGIVNTFSKTLALHFRGDGVNKREVERRECESQGVRDREGDIGSAHIENHHTHADTNI